MAKIKKAPAKKNAKKPAKKAVKNEKKAAPAKKRVVKKAAIASKDHSAQEKMRDSVINAIEKNKGENLLCVDVRGQSALADFLIIASGKSTRQVAGLAENVRKALLASGARQVRVEGLPQGDWAIVDGGDVVVHLFRPEVRHFYRLEEVWGLEPPLQETFKKL